MRRIAIGAILALALLTALSASAMAARGGNGKALGNGNGNGASATLTLSPNPVAAGSEHSVDGSGFAPNKLIVVAIRHSETPWTASYYSISSDASGAFSFRWYSGMAGEVVHGAYQQKGNGSNYTLIASATLVVVAP